MFDGFVTDCLEDIKKAVGCPYQKINEPGLYQTYLNVHSLWFYY